jgi:hypothetical protein
MFRIALALCLICAQGLFAQSYPLHYESSARAGSATASDLGRLTALGDLDGDGAHDFALQTEEGNWHFVSGASGSFLFALEVSPAGEGSPLALAPSSDLDADGTDDFIRVFGASLDRWDARHIEARSGLDGSLIWEDELRLPFSSGFIWGLKSCCLAIVGDQDGDGVRDLALGFGVMTTSLDVLSHGGLEVRSGASGAVLHSAVSVGHALRSVANLGDLDADGSPEFAVGAPDALVTAGEAGGVALLRGQSFGFQRFWSGQITAEGFGNGILGAGDIDGDGVGDLLLSSRSGGAQGAGYVAAFSGADGHRIWQRDHDAELGVLENLGLAPGAGFDWDGDGIKDAILSHDNASFQGRPIYSGAHGGSIGFLSANEVVLGDVNGDLLPERARIVTDAFGNRRVRVEAHKGLALYGAAATSFRVEWMANSHRPERGQLAIRGGQPFATASIIGSFGPGADLSPFGPGMILIDIDGITLWEDVVLDAGGSHDSFISMSVPWYENLVIYYQVLESPTGRLSNGFEILFDA